MQHSEQFTNIKESDLNYFFRAYKWALRTPVFKYDDPFKVEHRFSYNFLREMHADVLVSKLSFTPFKYVEMTNCDWSLLISNWWNEKIYKWERKQPALYRRRKT